MMLRAPRVMWVLGAEKGAEQEGGRWMTRRVSDEEEMKAPNKTPNGQKGAGWLER